MDATPLASEADRATIIRGLPRGICSWNYQLTGDASGALTELSGMGEHGRIRVHGEWFDIKKDSWLSGSWSMLHADQVVASAQKTSPLSRTFVIDSPSGDLNLIADSAFSRRFTLSTGGRPAARFIPDHAFTRRCSIERTSDELDSPILLFGFWLVVLMWRRATQNS